MIGSVFRPLVTVVTVTFNAEKVIEATLASICEQTSRNFEWLVVDGLSTDATMAIVGADRDTEGFGIRSLSERDRGLYDAMNKGVALARGDYLIFINAGDALFDRNVLSDFETYIQTRASRPVMVYGHTHVQLSDGKFYLRKVRPLNYIWHGQPTIHQGVFFERNVHSENLYPFEKYPVSSDYAVIASIQKKHCHSVEIWNRTVSIFDNDPSSFGNRQLWQRIKDAWDAQRDVNGTRLDLRILSAAKRLAANVFYNFR